MTKPDHHRWNRVALGLGSNLEVREEHLLSAALALAEQLLSARISQLVSSPPQDCPPGSPDFLNAALVGLTAMAPDELLGLLKAIEHRAERRAGTRYAPRTLDCDLLVLGDIESDRPELTLPHPRLIERSFCTAPLRSVSPELVIPGFGRAGRLDPGDVSWGEWSLDSTAALAAAGIELAPLPSTDC